MYKKPLRNSTAPSSTKLTRTVFVLRPHIFTLEDAKGLLRAGIDAFAHGVRDKDIDDEFLNMMKQRPAVVVVPNLPDRGVAQTSAGLGRICSSGRIEDPASRSDRSPAVQQTFGIQSRNLNKLNAAGVRIALGTDGNVAWAHHLEMEDMVASGMTPAQGHRVRRKERGRAAKADRYRHDRYGEERRFFGAGRKSS
jgi:imidazolonepropionase-like amidohydrolase